MPNAEAMFVAMSVPSGSTFGRCWLSLPAPKKADVIHLLLTPRSAYVLRGVARWGWQHSVAPTPALRYSITFRTRAACGGARARRA